MTEAGKQFWNPPHIEFTNKEKINQQSLSRIIIFTLMMGKRGELDGAYPGIRAGV
jgi:hypothetical protein